MKTTRCRKYSGFFILSIILSLFFIHAFSCRQHRSDNVKIGILYPMTGELADKGIDSIRALQMAADEINSRGGIKSMNGALIELVYGDTKGDPSSGVSEAERLILKEKVSALIGTYQSSVTKPATQLAERYRTPFIVSISLADIITEREFKYTFRVQPKAEYYCRDQALFLIDYAKGNKRRIRRIALLHENSDFGTSTALTQKRILTEYGFEVVADVSYIADGVKNLRSEVRKVLSAGPDAIITVTYFNDSVLIFRELAALKIKIPVIDTAGGTVSTEFISTMGSDSEKIFTSAEYSKYTSNGRELNRRFRNRFGIDMTGDSAYAYQSLLVIKDALERSASRDRSELRTAIASTDMKYGGLMILPSERIRFDSSGQNEFARLFIVQIQNGEYIPVWPAEFAAGAIRY